MKHNGHGDHAILHRYSYKEVQMDQEMPRNYETNINADEILQSSQYLSIISALLNNFWSHPMRSANKLRISMEQQ